MRKAGTMIYTDPDDYRTVCGIMNVRPVFAGPGALRMRLTSVRLPHIRLLDIEENLPRVACFSPRPGNVLIAFSAHKGPPQQWDGEALNARDIVILRPGECLHHQTRGVARWSAIALPLEYLVRYGNALTGKQRFRPPRSRILRPSRLQKRQLLTLYAKACRVATARPEVIAHPEAARSLEQELVLAIVNCLTGSDPPARANPRQRQARTMARLEHVLAANPDRSLRMPVLCAALGVPERTLRSWCATCLGMSPARYIRLRRLNMVRSELRRSASSAIGIEETARRHGFTEPGRFAVLYRTTFGESPSTTRARISSFAEFA